MVDRPTWLLVLNEIHGVEGLCFEPIWEGMRLVVDQYFDFRGQLSAGRDSLRYRVRRSREELPDPSFPDDEAGELPKAFVVKAAADLDEDGVKAFVKERVATYKQVRLVEFVDAIPKSASGKILRRELRER